MRLNFYPTIFALAFLIGADETKKNHGDKPRGWPPTALWLRFWRAFPPKLVVGIVMWTKCVGIIFTVTLQPLTTNNGF